MKLLLHSCINEEYSPNPFYGELKDCLLVLNESEPMEVSIDFSPAVQGYAKHYKHNLNLMLKNKDSKVSEHDSKYFTKVNWLDRQKILWLFKEDVIHKSNPFQAFLVVFFTIVLSLNLYKLGIRTEI
jgi:hypothetical protein